MGMSLLKSCSTNSAVSAPSPYRWTLLDKVEFPNAYALKVKYHEASNYEGVKVMVFVGKFKHRCKLDPHFENDILSPVARFRPDDTGWAFAINFADALSKMVQFNNLGAT